MRGGASILVTLLIAILVLGGYLLLGKSQISRLVRDLEQSREDLTAQRDDVRMKEAQIPQLQRQLPRWRKQLELFKLAIPSPIEDEKFLIALTEEAARNDIGIQGVEVVQAGNWIKDLTEEQTEELENLGVDVAAAKLIKNAFYSIRLEGAFNHQVQIFENLKRYRRLYTIDLIRAPATGGGGSVSRLSDPERTPLEISGRIYFGIPSEYYSIEGLEDVYIDAVAKPLVRNVQATIAEVAEEVYAPRASADDTVTDADESENESAAEAPSPDDTTSEQVDDTEGAQTDTESERDDETPLSSPLANL